MSQQLTKYEEFQSELKKRESDLLTMLPAGVNRPRFFNSTLAAVRQNPELLTATPRSLFSAVTKSYQDGLLADGKEGVITIYKVKNKSGAWEAHAQWNPMVWGLRKRAKELDNIIINAEIVYQNDEYRFQKGDEPKIIHNPAPLDQEPGPMVAAYAIFTRHNPDGKEILHREEMRKSEIEAVRSQSKQPDGLLWTKFVTEAWRKTVVRRGIKSVPCSEKLEAIAHRDDEAFDFSEPKPSKQIVQAPGDGQKLPLPPAIEAHPLSVGEILDQASEPEAVEIEQPVPVTAKPLPPPAKVKNGNGAAAKGAAAEKKAKEVQATAAPPAPAAHGLAGAAVPFTPLVPDPTQQPEAFREWVKGRLAKLNTEPEINQFWQTEIQSRKNQIFPPDMDDLMAVVTDRSAEIAKKVKEKATVS